MRTASDSWVPHGSLLEMFTILSSSKAAKVWYDQELYNNIMKTLRTLDEQERQKDYDALHSHVYAGCAKVTRRRQSALLWQADADSVKIIL